MTLPVSLTAMSSRKTIFVAGLGKVGIGTCALPESHYSRFVPIFSLLFLSCKRVADRTNGTAFIEKLLNLDHSGKYRIVTCGEEIYRMSYFLLFTCLQGP